jgi:PAS domain S-box-containing protein
VRILRGHGPEFAELLKTLGEAVTIRDRSDQLVYANRAALRLLGYDTLEEVQSRGLDEIMSEYVVVDDDGKPVEMSDLPSVRLLQGKPAEPLLIHSLHRRSGQARWELLKAAALRNGDGQLVAAVTVIEDVTAVKTAEVHMRLLSESGRILASSLDYQQTLVRARAGPQLGRPSAGVDRRRGRLGFRDA